MSPFLTQESRRQVMANDFKTVGLLRSVDMIHGKYETGASDYAY